MAERKASRQRHTQADGLEGAAGFHMTLNKTTAENHRQELLC